MTFPRRAGTPEPALNRGPAPDDVDYSQPITQGPREHGFDYFYGIPSSIDIAPYVYMENDRFLAPATVALQGGRGMSGFNPGKAAEGFAHVDVMPRTVAKATEYIATRARNPQQPFFLFFASTGVHNPIVPAPPCVGKSAAGPYGDFIEQMDDSVGQIVAALRAANLERDTMIIFTSDNGPAPLTTATSQPAREAPNTSATQTSSPRSPRSRGTGCRATRPKTRCPLPRSSGAREWPRPSDHHS